MRNHRGNGSGHEPADPSPSDAELVRRVLDGRRDDYRLLVRRYQERLYGFALGMVGDPDAAADLVQDAFVKAYTGIDGCPDPSKFEAWIYRILRNRCREYMAALTRGQEPGAEDAGRARAGEPAQDGERPELRWTLRDALACLPGAHLEAFLLRHLHGHTEPEISEMLDVPVSAVRMRVRRSRKILWSHVSERKETGPDVTSPEAGSSTETEAGSTANHPVGEGP